MAETKSYRQDALSGGLDTRNPDGSCSPEAYRFLLNVDGSEANPMRRLPGWRKYGFNQECFNNRDLHDQMVAAQKYQLVGTTAGETCAPGELTSTHTCHEAITFLKSIPSPNGRRRLMAGTHSRLYVNDDKDGNWRIIADELGGACFGTDDCECSNTRFRSATLGDQTVLANNVDPVLIWQFDAENHDCKRWSADYLIELLALGISTAEFVVEYQGFILIANVVQDGQRITNRIFWSDFNDATAWTPGSESLAGFQDLGSSEEIRGMETIGGKLRVYTNKRIYDATLVGDTQLAQSGLVFAFNKIYEGERVPVFKNTLIKADRQHYYLGQETMYRMSEYDTEPTEFPWMRFAAGVIFGGAPAAWMDNVTGASVIDPINRAHCDSAVAGWRERDGSVWFSWATGESKCPNVSLVIWPDNAKATVVDHGFTAFEQHATDSSNSWRGLLADIGLCDPEDNLDPKEGSPCPVNYTPVAYPYLWNVSENGGIPMGTGAVFAQFCDLCLEDLCKACQSDVRFVMASASDYCLKEFSTETFFRERLTGMTSATFPEVGVGTYVQDGYTTLLRVDANGLKSARTKIFRRMQVGYTADIQDPPAQMHCDVGGGEDPRCLMWEAGEPADLECIGASGVYRPDSYLRYTFYTTGIYLAWQLWVSGVGGQFAIASVEQKITHDER